MKLDGTAFQNRVWSSLAKIPFGKTITYKQQAVSIKSPAADRAVGRTNGLNPLCIVLPCHRVIGSSGSLTGYAGGLRAKKYLLELEGSKKNI
jgi:O-6-methylguanine DNA methyltransferase